MKTELFFLQGKDRAVIFPPYNTVHKLEFSALFAYLLYMNFKLGNMALFTLLNQLSKPFLELHYNFILKLGILKIPAKSLEFLEIYMNVLNKKFGTNGVCYHGKPVRS